MATYFLTYMYGSGEITSVNSDKPFGVSLEFEFEGELTLDYFSDKRMNFKNNTIVNK